MYSISRLRYSLFCPVVKDMGFAVSWTWVCVLAVLGSIFLTWARFRGKEGWKEVMGLCGVWEGPWGP